MVPLFYPSLLLGLHNRTLLTLLRRVWERFKKREESKKCQHSGITRLPMSPVLYYLYLSMTGLTSI